MSDAISIEQSRQNRTTERQWQMYAPHRRHIERLIVPSRPGGKLCVLGAGNCNDLDLRWLTDVFAEVHLVDLDGEALRSALARQKIVEPKRIVLHAPVDLTGIADRIAAWPKDANALVAELWRCIEILSEFGGASNPGATGRRTRRPVSGDATESTGLGVPRPVAPNDRATAGRSQFDGARRSAPTLALPRITGGGERGADAGGQHVGVERSGDAVVMPWGLCDVVLSPCVLTQMIVPARDASAEILPASHPAVVAMRVALRMRHLHLMAASLVSGGRGVLVLDLVSSETVPELARITEAELPAAMDRFVASEKHFRGLEPKGMMAALGHVRGVEKPEIHSPWLWHLGLRKSFLVYGVTFRKGKQKNPHPGPPPEYRERG